MVENRPGAEERGGKVTVRGGGGIFLVNAAPVGYGRKSGAQTLEKKRRRELEDYGRIRVEERNRICNKENLRIHRVTILKGTFLLSYLKERRKGTSPKMSLQKSLERFLGHLAVEKGGGKRRHQSISYNRRGGKILYPAKRKRWRGIAARRSLIFKPIGRMDHSS